MSKKKDYYEILGINRDANADEIKRAFRRLAKRYHPDINKEAGASERFVEINEAYQVLSDSKKRAQYDQFGHAGLGGDGAGGGSPFGNMNVDLDEILRGFGDFFGGGFGGGSRQTRHRNVDITYQLEIDFMTAMKGAEKKITIENHYSCSECKGKGTMKPDEKRDCRDCNGRGSVIKRGLFGMQQKVPCGPCTATGKVYKELCPSCKGKRMVKKKEDVSIQIPPGVGGRFQLFINRNGPLDIRNNYQGAQTLVFKVRPHPVFKREGDNLISKIPIDYTTALLGGTISLPTIDGAIETEITGPVKDGKILRMKNRGAFSPENSKKRGDHFFQLFIVYPDRISSDVRKRLEEIRNEAGFQPNSDFVKQLRKKGLIPDRDAD